MKPVIQAFNRGRISPLALARTDFKRTAMSAEVMTNWMPRALGSMMLRPGTEYLGTTRSSAAAIAIPFIFAVDDTARLELTDGVMRVWVDDELIERPAVSTAITNGTFATDLSGWTDADEAGAVSIWVAPSFLGLFGNNTTAARRRQLVTCVNPNVVHALDISVNRGPLKLRVGSTSGGEEYVEETTLREGEHNIAFTPTGDFYVELFNYTEYPALVDNCTISASGVMEVTAPWAAAFLDHIRWDQSGDVVFVACTGYRQRRIERRDNNSWSIVVYQSEDGPFQLDNTGPITMTPDNTTGQANLTASAAYFRSGHVGSLFRLTQDGQSASANLTAENTFTDPIRINGVDGARVFAVIITGTFVATVTLQYSVGAVGSWVDTATGSWTAPTSVSYDDTLDNQIIYYRLGIKTGGYTSGTAALTISTPSGSQTGVLRVDTVASATVANCSVMSDLGDITATTDWAESYWSDELGYPSSVALYEGRLWWAGKDRVWGSVSDNYHSFDDLTEGDSGPLSRSIGSGPVDRIYWMMPMQRLILGAGGSIWSVRSSAQDEPITPTNFNLKDISGQGSATLAAVKLDKNGCYVQRSRTRLYEVAYEASEYEYGADDLAKHVPEIGEPAIIRLAVQRQPETRVHCIKSDGTVAILILDRREEVQCWVDYETDGDVEDVIVEPGDVEDKVTYLVKRTINGSTVRYYERWALESECVGGTLNKQADSFLSGTGSAATITGLDHLEGESVVCWADGDYKGAFTVASGAISQSYASGYVVGLGYTAQFKSAKLAAIIPDGASLLCSKQRISRLGIVARDIHPTGLQYGPDFDTLDNLPTVEDGAAIDGDTMRSDYDEPSFGFNGNWNSDSRLCLQATAPKPVTLLACVLEI